MEPKFRKLVLGVLAVAVVAACATDATNMAEPAIEIDRITIWPDAKPVESFRERLGRFRERMAGLIESGETLPSDVLERWEKMEKMEARYRRLEANGYQEQVVGPGQSIMVLPDSGLGDAAASARCGNPNVAEIFMDICY